MHLNEKPRVPVAGITEPLESLGKSVDARNPGVIDDWIYPEDVPSSAMRQHPRPRRSWSLRDFLLLALCCVLFLWMGVSLAIGQTYYRL